MTLPDGLVILQPGGKLPGLASCRGDFADWILAGMGVAGRDVPVLRPQTGEALPDPRAVSAVVVTGSSAMVTDPDAWVARSSDWLAELVARGRPVLGICFGHQLLAQALGGEVGDNPRGVEVGTVTTRPQPGAVDDPLLGAWPAETRVQASHRQSVWRLPEGAVCLAASDKDPHHAFRYGECCWGVQFHPEFSPQVVAAYIDYYAQDLAKQGESAAQLHSRVGKTPQATGLLLDFTQILQK